jgi:hypothetical protein
MTRRKVDRTHGGASIERLNELHAELVEASFEALKNEREAGEIKPATLNVLRQLCSDGGVQPTRDQQEAFHSLNLALSKIQLKEIGQQCSL